MNMAGIPNHSGELRFPLLGTCLTRFRVLGLGLPGGPNLEDLREGDYSLSVAAEMEAIPCLLSPAQAAATEGSASFLHRILSSFMGNIYTQAP